MVDDVVALRIKRTQPDGSIITLDEPREAVAAGIEWLIQAHRVTLRSQWEWLQKWQAGEPIAYEDYLVCLTSLGELRAKIDDVEEMLLEKVQAMR